MKNILLIVLAELAPDLDAIDLWMKRRYTPKQKAP